MKNLVSVDFFTVPTLRFQVLYVFLVLAHDRRWTLHFGVTAHPTAEWTAQQLREAFPWDTAPRYLFAEKRDVIRRMAREALEEDERARRCRWTICFDAVPDDPAVLAFVFRSTLRRPTGRQARLSSLPEQFVLSSRDKFAVPRAVGGCEC